VTGGDVEKDQLVCAFCIVPCCLRDWIPGVAQRLEVHSFHDPPTGNVEAGNNSSG
jgi:hypothetical protein